MLLSELIIQCLCALAILLIKLVCAFCLTVDAFEHEQTQDRSHARTNKSFFGVGGFFVVGFFGFFCFFVF